MKKLFVLLLLFIITVFTVGCSNEDIPQDKISDFSISISLSATQPDTLPDYGSQVFINNKKQIKIVKPKNYPEWGDIITWNTKSATLTDSELQEFKTLLDKINISKLPSAYVCNYSTNSNKIFTMKECYVDEPILRSEGASSIRLSIEGEQKEVHMSTSNGVPDSLKDIIKRMIDIRDRLLSVPWSKQTSTYQQLFN